MNPKGKSILFDRQKLLLALLDAIGGRIANLDFQKLLFLYCQRSVATAVYEFVPYKFGAFSFTSYADRRTLVERGFLADDDKQWVLTEKGRQDVMLAHEVEHNLKGFARKYNILRGDALVAETYRCFPYYAIHSEIVESVLRGDSVSQKRIEDVRPRPQKKKLFTIGYEGRSLEKYLNELIRAGVDILCDVRKNALSRKYGFSKVTLSKSCEGVGIRYVHMPELGIASEQRQALNTQADYEELFDKYKRDNLPQQHRALEKIRDWVDSGQRVALTCYERFPQQCHRHCIAEALEMAFGQNFMAKHL